MLAKTTPSLSEMREGAIRNWDTAVDLTAREKIAWAAGNKREAERLGALAWFHIKTAVLLQQEYIMLGGQL